MYITLTLTHREHVKQLQTRTMIGLIPNTLTELEAEYVLVLHEHSLIVRNPRLRTLKISSNMYIVIQSISNLCRFRHQYCIVVKSSHN